MELSRLQLRRPSKWRKTAWRPDGDREDVDKGYKQQVKAKFVLPEPERVGLKERPLKRPS